MQNIKTKIVVLVISIVCVFALLGVGVWAILTQTVNARTYINVKDDGQAKCVITVSDYVGPSNNSTLEELVTEPQFNQVLEKLENQDEASGEFSQNVTFSYTNYYRYVLIKVEIENKSTVAVTYDISFTDMEGNAFVFSYPIETAIYTLSSSEGFQLETSTGTGRIEVGGATTKYVAIKVTDGYDLWDLPDVILQAFKLNVEVTV